MTKTIESELPAAISPQRCDPDTWVDAHGDALYTYAFIRVRDTGLAEELVQESFLSALKALHRFQGRSSERTWLIGILKHKIFDYYRRQERGHDIPVGDYFDATMEKSTNFDESWLSGTALWLNEPHKFLEQKEFFLIFQEALGQLPVKLSEVFVLHELDGLKGEEICTILNISANNLAVMLYRARMQLKGIIARSMQKAMEIKRTSRKKM